MVRIQRFLFVVLWLSISSALAGCEQHAAASSEGQRELDKQLVRRWMDVGFNQRIVAVVDEVFTDSVAINGVVIPRDGLKASMSQHFAAFPDLHVTINAVVAEGKSIGVWYTAVGTHQGPFQGVSATGKILTWKGVDLFTLQGGKVSEALFLSELSTQLIAVAK
jgi:steroid delta-isomerase-like uncharacterized protein